MESSSELKALALDALSQVLPTGIAILDTSFCYVSINSILAEFNGVPIEQHLGRNVAEVLPELAKTVMPLLKQVRDTGKAILNFKVTEDSSDAEQSHWSGSYIPLFNAEQQLCGIAVVALNSTMDWFVQQTRKDDLERLRKILDNMFSFVGILSPDGTLLDANKPPLELAGISLEHVRRKKFWDCFWWQHDINSAKRIKKAVEDARAGIISRFDITAQMKNEVVIIDFMLAPVYDDNEQLSFLVPSAIEITSRKRSEQELQDSETRFRRVFDSTADGLVSIDDQGLITLANTTALQMFGYEAGELTGQPIEVLLPERYQQHHPALRQGFMLAPTTRPMGQHRELHAKRKNNTEFPVEIGLTYLEGDKKAAVLATITDVSAAKAAQQHLQGIIDEKTALLAERTLLLNEVHHRVKNNLQIVSSLLSLKSRGATPELKQVLLESQLRVRTMALTHQLLYEKRDFSSVPLASYLRQLCQLVRQTLTNTDFISFEFDQMDEQIVLVLEQAIPCGLLATEILTNSIKHAFPEQQKGQVKLALTQENQRITLKIGDNGIGLPESVELGQGNSLGMQLIPAFIAQLGAQIELNRQQGTLYCIHFSSTRE
ncbi:PAS domain S-box/PAS domain S-box [Rheinheimera sp. A13L]|uniref:PAS domain-containing sensor histidine kinase n=1 Tax=Rheinheimera sp. A13L TaxID=506534 RepID=UPI00021250BB|nr:PAS domain S-box protein [Rheinheimera sp. A13L]EGM78912.1 PAS domain S-box/PAS domain S-box [Rheinheimera sp. A13L]